ncbi:MAG: hypothetical protein ACI9EF_000957 [Pseudohongiellaceae bacterium]|jgi:hypothetical protein
MVLMSSRGSLRYATLLAVLALVFVSPRGSAQCFGPDNLDSGSCCTATVPNLPIFPAGNPSALGVCWNNCGVAGTQNLSLQWTPPSQVVCGEYISQLTVVDGTGTAVLSGTLVLDYTRTWDEIDTAGNITQVWRFAAKADLSGVAGAPPVACVQPSCITPAGPYGTAFYYGYVDYANCDPTVPWDNVLVLFHNCDRFIHAPGLSDKPGSFHPGSSYALVAPHSTLQPFVPGNAFASGGTIIGEATRNVPSLATPPAPCTVEDRVAFGTINKLGAGCVCSLSTTPKQQTLREIKGQTSCVNAIGVPGSFTSVNLGFPTFPWFHVVSSSIGRWTSPIAYPGTEACWVDEGLFAIQEPCTGDFAEIKYGGSTRGGWMALLPLPILVDNFTDMADNYTAPLFGPYPGPFVGSIQPTEHLLYINVP